MSKRCTLCDKELTSGQIICLECATELKTEPTEEEVFKEFEEKGWKYKFINGRIKGLLLYKSTKECIYEITIVLENKIYYSQNTSYFHCGITLEAHQLLTKLFKAWGWFG